MSSTRSHRFTQSFAVAVLLVDSAFFCAVAGEPGAAPEEAGRIGILRQQTAPILRAMQDLESVRDAKCHSTACRFEDFIYGSPLTNGAREAKIELQKRLVARIWRNASDAARRHGEDRISPSRIEPLLAASLRFKSTPSGDVKVSLVDGTNVLISGVRLRQYSSIAYALRAVLGVHQDGLFSDAPPTVTLEPKSLDALTRLLNIATMSALKLADESARRQNEPRISASTMSQAWQRVVTAIRENTKESEPVADEVVRTSAASADHPFEVLHALIEEKIASYEVYNKTRNVNREVLLLRNIASYYARYYVPGGQPGERPPTPRQRKAVDRFLRAHDESMVLFSRRLLLETQGVAQQNGHNLMRVSDAE